MQNKLYTLLFYHAKLDLTISSPGFSFNKLTLQTPKNSVCKRNQDKINKVEGFVTSFFPDSPIHYQILSVLLRSTCFCFSICFFWNTGYTLYILFEKKNSVTGLVAQTVHGYMWHQSRSFIQFPRQSGKICCCTSINISSSHVHILDHYKQASHQFQGPFTRCDCHRNISIPN